MHTAKYYIAQKVLLKNNQQREKLIQNKVHQRKHKIHKNGQSCLQMM